MDPFSMFMGVFSALKIVSKPTTTIAMMMPMTAGRKYWSVIDGAAVAGGAWGCCWF